MMAKRGIPALILAVALPGCGGGPEGVSDFIELLARLLSSRFVPATITVPRGSTRAVDRCKCKRWPARR
jgi:hypothetical protein